VYLLSFLYDKIGKLIIVVGFISCFTCCIDDDETCAAAVNLLLVGK